MLKIHFIRSPLSDNDLVSSKIWIKYPFQFFIVNGAVHFSALNFISLSSVCVCKTLSVANLFIQIFVVVVVGWSVFILFRLLPFIIHIIRLNVRVFIFSCKKQAKLSFSSCYCQCHGVSSYCSSIVREYIFIYERSNLISLIFFSALLWCVVPFVSCEHCALLKRYSGSLAAEYATSYSFYNLLLLFISDNLFQIQTNDFTSHIWQFGLNNACKVSRIYNILQRTCMSVFI